MSRLNLWALLACLLAVNATAAPQLRVQARVQPATDAVVGGLLELQLDILTDTWFTSAPILPELQLDDAVVLPPAGQAEHLNERVDGQSLNGLRYRYRIAPQVAGGFDIPALTVRVTPGQADHELTAQSAPVHFNAQPIPGMPSTTAPLVASAVRLSQRTVTSETPLRVGDSITRELTLQADGTLAMTLPAPPMNDQAGLSRYLKAPQVTTIDDGRGGFLGGQRIDNVTYRIDRPGSYTLPAVQVTWWDNTARQLRTTQAPPVTFDAVASNATAPVFSISEDLKHLRQSQRLHIPAPWLAGLAMLLAISVTAYGGRGLARRAYLSWQARQAARRRAWEQSAEYAWRRVSPQLNARPPQLSALYLWLRRSRLGLSLTTAAPALLPALRGFYGREPSGDAALAQLQHGVSVLRKLKRQQVPARFPALRPLNPPHEKDVP